MRPLLLTFVTLTFALEASGTALVFDFESGLQGWTLGTVERVSGAPLGGDFAIFGEASGLAGELGTGPFMWIDLDLSDYSFLTFSQFRTSSADSLINFVVLGIRPIPDPGGFVFFHHPVSLLANAEDPMPNPDLRRVDLLSFEGLHRVSFVWTTVNLDPSSGFVDDVAFHPVPEPGTAILVSLGLAVLARLQRVRPNKALQLTGPPPSPAKLW